MWPRVEETEIGAALCALRRGRNLTHSLTQGIGHTVVTHAVARFLAVPTFTEMRRQQATTTPEMDGSRHILWHGTS